MKLNDNIGVAAKEVVTHSLQHWKLPLEGSKMADMV